MVPVDDARGGGSGAPLMPLLFPGVPGYADAFGTSDIPDWGHRWCPLVFSLFCCLPPGKVAPAYLT